MAKGDGAQGTKEGEEGHEGAGDTWRLFMRLLQHMWDTGEIPRQMLLSVVVLHNPKRGQRLSWYRPAGGGLEGFGGSFR